MTSAGADAQAGSDLGERRRVVARVDQPVSIRLWEDRTRGEQWVPSFDPSALALVDDEYLRIAGNNAVDNGQRTFTFRPVQAGLHPLVFEKRLGWKFTAEDRRLFDVEVTDPSGS